MSTAFTLATAEGHQARVTARGDCYVATVTDRIIRQSFTVPLKFGATFTAEKVAAHGVDPRHVQLVHRNGHQVLFVGRMGLLGGGRGDDPYTCTNCGFVCPNGARYDDCVHHDHGCEQAVKMREERRQKEIRRKAAQKKQEDELARQRFAIAIEEVRQKEQKKEDERKKQEKIEEQKKLDKLRELQEQQEMDEELERYQNEIRIII